MAHPLLPLLTMRKRSRPSTFRLSAQVLVLAGREQGVQKLVQRLSSLVRVGLGGLRGRAYYSSALTFADRSANLLIDL